MVLAQQLSRAASGCLYNVLCCRIAALIYGLVTTMVPFPSLSFTVDALDHFWKKGNFARTATFWTIFYPSKHRTCPTFPLASRTFLISIAAGLIVTTKITIRWKFFHFSSPLTVAACFLVFFYSAHLSSHFFLAFTSQKNKVVLPIEDNLVYQKKKNECQDSKINI